MSHLTRSALQEHRLESILPHPFPVQQQILKTKQFYKPEEFIWNNPHRASRRMYKFYHAYNQHYQMNKAPLIKQLQAHDREQAEQIRIQKLISFRNQTRKQFQYNQEQRVQLQNKARQRSTPSQKYTQEQVPHFHTITHENQFQRQKPHKQRQQPKSQRLARIEQTFRSSVKKYDMKTGEIQQMIRKQNRDYHNQVRSEFISRKMTNDTNPHFYPQKKRTIQ